MTAEQIAAVCHEANRRYCREMGEPYEGTWEEIPQWQKDHDLAGVRWLLRFPAMTARDSHQIWLNGKVEMGWTLGPVKDEEKKQHPHMVPFEELPEQQRAKARLFRDIVNALREREMTGETCKTLGCGRGGEKPSGLCDVCQFNRGAWGAP